MALPPTISPKMVQAMFLNIVKGYPFHQCRQIETFAVIDTADQFESDNLGMSYNNFLDGSYWSRGWVNEGADANTLCKKYPILSIETKQGYLKDVCRPEYCFRTWIVISDIPDCGNCKDECIRTQAALDQDLFIMMQTILKEMRRYRYVVCTIEGEDNIQGWFTPESAAQIAINNTCVTFQDCHDICTVLTEQGRVDIQIADLANSDGARAVTASLTYCGCNEVESDAFTYDDVSPDPVSNTKCDNC